jgi:hypothetical protein
MTDAVIVSTARTGLAKSWKGAFNMTHGATLGAHSVKHAVARAKLDPAEVEDVLMGCATPEGACGSNIARQIALAAGLPVTVPGATVNRFCSSGLQTIAMAAQRIIAGEVRHPRRRRRREHFLRAAGSQPPHDHRPGPAQAAKPEIYWNMLQTAEQVAKRYKIGKDRQDEYGVRSQSMRAAAAGRRQVQRRDRADDRHHGRRRQGHRRPDHARSHHRRRRGHPPRHHAGRRLQDPLRDSRRRDHRRQCQPVFRRLLGLRGDECQSSPNSAASSRWASSAASPWPAASPTKWASARCSRCPSC